MADGTVRIHPDEGLLGVVFVFPVIHFSGVAPAAVEGDTGI